MIARFLVTSLRLQQSCDDRCCSCCRLSLLNFKLTVRENKRSWNSCRAKHDPGCVGISNQTAYSVHGSQQPSKRCPHPWPMCDELSQDNFLVVVVFHFGQRHYKWEETASSHLHMVNLKLTNDGWWHEQWRSSWLWWRWTEATENLASFNFATCWYNNNYWIHAWERSKPSLTFQMGNVAALIR